MCDPHHPPPPLPSHSCCKMSARGTGGNGSSSSSRGSHEAEEDGGEPSGTGRRPADASAARDGSKPSTTKTKTSTTTTTDTTKDLPLHVAEGAAFTPSPEILFLVQQQAKTLSTLSAISKRLEELEVKVCDIQRTVSATHSNHKKLDHLSPSSSSKCSASGQQQQLNVLSDDSGGEYSRTTNGTTVDEDELISLLDQIAKYSQTIRDTQQTQAQQQLASLSPPHHPSASRPLHPDTRRDQCNSAAATTTVTADHPSSSPAVLMSDHPASSSARLNHNHHAHHHNQAVQQQHRNQSLTHASHPSRSSAAAFPGLRTGMTDFRSGGHLVTQSSPAVADSSSSLGALLFDPNLSSVLTNLLTPPRSRNRDF